MGTKKSKLIKSRKHLATLEQKMDEFNKLKKSIRRLLISYRNAEGQEAVLLEEQIEVALEDLNKLSMIINKWRKYYEELIREFEELREEKHKKENGGENEDNPPND